MKRGKAKRKRRADAGADTAESIGGGSGVGGSKMGVPGWVGRWPDKLTLTWNPQFPSDEQRREIELATVNTGRVVSKKATDGSTTAASANAAGADFCRKAVDVW